MLAFNFTIGNIFQSGISGRSRRSDVRDVEEAESHFEKFDPV